MEQLLDEESVFLSAGHLFYQISKKRAISMSTFIRWCLNSGQKSEFVHWVSLGSKPKQRLSIVRLYSKSVNEVTLTKVAHYLQTDHLVGLNAFDVADILRVGQMLGVTGVTRICSDFLMRLFGQLPGKSSEEMTVLRRAIGCLDQFPNRAFLLALMMKAKVMETDQNWIWDIGIHIEDNFQRKTQFLSHSLIPSSRKDGAKHKGLFSDLGTEVAPEDYVYSDAEILYMMEMTSVHEGQDAADGIDIFGKKREKTPESPRTLPEEWRLSPARSVDLEEEFRDMDREFLHAIYDDN